MSQLPLSPQVFAILASLVEDQLGLHYRAADADLLASKVSDRALEAGFTSLLDYYYFLRYDPGGGAELDALADALVVNETYFFREAPQLRALADHVLAPIAKTRRARVWCAACSTGEEPLSLAMLLEMRGLLPQVEIVASDISKRALSQARSGRWGPRSLRQNAFAEAETAGLLARDGDRVTIDERVHRSVDFRRVNLLDRTAVASLGSFDAVLCRNVLIYFADETTRTVIGHLTSALRPGGHLLLGVSESLLRLSTPLACEEIAGTFFYRRGGP